MVAMATAGQLEVTIGGCGPYGFRLSGGDGQPLSISKLRKQSKGCQAGLKEGDFLLGINGYSCQSMKHDAAMALLENAVSSLDLIIFRGTDVSALNEAFDKLTLRPLSPGSVPAQRKLPPPPSADAGALVIDQPTFLRQTWARPTVIAEVPEPEPPKPSFAPPVAAEHPLEQPAFHVSTFSVPPKTWNPAAGRGDPGPRYAAQPQPPMADHHDDGRAAKFNVSRPSAKPWVWTPTEKYTFIRTEVTEIAPAAENDSAVANHHPQQQQQNSAPTTPAGRDRVDGGAGHGQVEEVIPRWALPLRSEYDWRAAFCYTLPDEDEWEMTADGQYCIRKKKIFSDSSFYDDPIHKYPTIEEQIKMARKVAQSLTAAGNVAARGQRMFLRRREKADRWTIDSFMPLSKRGVAAPGVPRQGPGYYDMAESDTEAEVPYYNPTPWKSVPYPSAINAPWLKKSDAARSASPLKPAAAAPPPPPGPPPAKWTPITPSAMPAVVPTSPAEQPALQPRPTKSPKIAHAPGSVPPSVAFGLANEMRQMKDKGGRLFAKKRARAVAEEQQDADEETSGARAEVMRRIASSHAAAAIAEEMNGDARREESLERERAPSVPRLLEMIERSRGTVSSLGSDVADSRPSPIRGHVAAPTKNVDFSSKKGGFRPVRFRAPIGTSTVETTEGISEF